MKRLWTMLAVVAVPTLSLTALAQTPNRSSDGAIQSTKSDTNDNQNERIEANIRDLGADDYQVRDRAYDALRKLGATAKPQLDKATQSEDPEIRWRAGRLLRALALGEEPTASKAGSSDPAPKKNSPRALRRLDPGSNDDDSAADSNDNDVFRGLRDWRGTDPGVHRHMEDLQRQMQQVQREMERLMREAPQTLTPGTIQQKNFGSTLRMDDNGVEATITDNKDGKEVTETYKAKDLDDFKAKYPEVAQKLGLDRMPFRFSGPLGGSGSTLLRIPRTPATPTPLSPTPFRGASDGPKLGVVIQSPGPELAEHLGLSEGEGLLVNEVVPDSLAAKLGIQKSDIVLEVNGKIVGSSDDVYDALEPTKNGGTVKVKIVRRGEEKVLTAKPSTDSKEK